MKPEEAIEKIEHLLDPEPWEEHLTPPYVEALKLAIQSLSLVANSRLCRKWGDTMTLQEKRLNKGWSQPELAKQSGVSVKVIRSLECGYRDVNKSQLVTLVNICRALECPISDILTDETLKEKMKKCERF